MSDQSAFLKEAEDLRRLRMLEEIERNPSVTQRELSRNLGVALSVVNACLQTLVRKGMLKVRGENNRSITYHLTKSGLLHKARLAVEWTGNTVDFYLQMRGRLVQQLSAMRLSGMRKAVIFGSDETAELVAIVSRDAGIELLGLVPTSGRVEHRRLVDLPVVPLAEVERLGADALIVCVSPAPQELAELQRVLAGRLPVLTLAGTTLFDDPQTDEEAS